VFNTCLVLPLFFIVYDFFYAPFHRALHHRSVYAYVHKHHHRQVVPTRGNTDAINVHPFEFIMGEYNHVRTIFLVSRYVVRIHAISCVLFLLVGGMLATLNVRAPDHPIRALDEPAAQAAPPCTPPNEGRNPTPGQQPCAHVPPCAARHSRCLRRCSRCLQHTRLDCSFLRVPFTNIPIFAVRAHDTHHAIPNTNYGQYIMLWDYAMGTFKLHPQDPGSREMLKAEAEAKVGASGKDKVR
jgi:sterol desaturase/sphingolipid hydroxylase (fatty acid hydroxylase superfamily)